MAEKVTTMVLKVDLECGKCYKKLKKVLCKFPQIQDEVYDEKNNLVTIKVVCSCCSPENLRDKLCRKGGGVIKSIEIKDAVKPKPTQGNNNPKPIQPPEPVISYPPSAPGYPIPIWTCCPSCYVGRGGGPCFRGHGVPLVCYGGYCGRPVCDSYGGGRPCCDYCSEENPWACTIM